MTGREKGSKADLEALKKRLLEKEAAQKKAAPARPVPPSPAQRKAHARPAPPAPPAPPAAPEPPVSFDDEMKRMGVAPPVRGADRVVVIPKAAGPRRDVPGATPADEAPPEGLDEESLWKHAVKGATPRGKGVARSVPQRTEALPTLDLHGMTEDDALHELRRFVGLHRGREPKWVRVIPGRGTHGLGVLRRAVTTWLQATSQVATFRPAPPDQGGDGVLLVQLTKKAHP